MRATSDIELTPTPDPAFEENKRDPLSEKDAENNIGDEDAGSASSSETSGSILSESSGPEDSSVDDAVDEDPRAKVLSVLELESLFLASAPELSGEDNISDYVVLTSLDT